ncbi:hypothetical protein LCGC14_1333130 [marine sediment metagenome]|uniref:Uncharacterized protein n=1 Tax=marine sediment metagenome TaxID=412755 RepID=A0A0F9KGN4_9ZZZZ
MTDFGTLMREKAQSAREKPAPDVDMVSYILDTYPDLASLTAQLYDAASPFEALQEKATDPRVGLTQPVTVAEAEALNAALAACKEFMEK